MQPVPGIFYIEQMGATSFVDAFPYTQVWEMICTQGVAQSILTKVQTLGLSNLSMVLQPQPFATYSIEPSLGFWVINGQTADGTQVSEYAGDLASRESNPNPFIDGKGGPNLHILEVSGIAELYWGS